MILTKRMQKHQHCHLVKIDKNEHLTGEEIPSPNQNRIIEQAKFTYSPIGENSEKQIKTIED